jgi:uncharacterized protein
MSSTAQLLKVFRVDQQLRGLRSRLTGAERFHSEQSRLLADLEGKIQQATTELKQLRTSIAGDETEAASITARMDKLRDQMNNAQTNKEYTAFLAELNNLKTKKDEVEKLELSLMEKTETLNKQLAEFTKQRDERKVIADKAKADRDAKAAEIKDRLDELTAQRAELAKGVPADALRILEEMIPKLGDEAMSPVEVVDRRNHEWACTSCQTVITVEAVNGLSLGKMTRCVNCRCILFSEEDVVSTKKPKDNEDIVKSKKRVSAKKAAAKGADDDLG